MLSPIQKWGDNFVILIPKALLNELAWNEHTQVEQTILEGKLILEAVTEPDYRMEQLLEAVTENNLHCEVDTGTRLGKEVF